VVKKGLFLKLPILRIIGWIVSLALFLAALGFAVKNSELVTLHYYLGLAWQAPLVVLLFIAFVLGAAAGVAASFSYGYRQRREILSLKRRERRSRARLEAEK
jgi:putative membrane protein